MMGNNPSSHNLRNAGDMGTSSFVNYQPMGFGKVHSENIRIFSNNREAKRFESFCKGICFGNRPVVIGERIYIVFTEISASWSGALRFGFTSFDPLTLNGAQLPRYACPDLTSKPGYWAKSLGERYAEVSNELCFYLTSTGDVHYSLNGEDKGIFFSGVVTSTPLWILLDIYGNTVGIKFSDGHQPLLRRATADANMEPSRNRGLPPAPQPTRGLPQTPLSNSGLKILTSPSIPVKYYKDVQLTTIKFHSVTGKNVMLSPDKYFTSRLADEYCNAYVFLERALKCGEKIVIQICGVDRSYVGGLAFGLTSHDPSLLCPNADLNQGTSVIAQSLPDDADHLLDRPEYWVVNKDVSPSAEVGDELSFSISSEGEVGYEKNGKFVTILMHVDKTLPLWPLFDLYGHTTSIKILGATTITGGGQPTTSQPVSLDHTFTDENALNSIANKGNQIQLPRPPPPPVQRNSKNSKAPNPPPRPLHTSPPTLNNDPPSNLPPPLVPQNRPARPAPLKPKPVLGVPQLNSKTEYQPNRDAVDGQVSNSRAPADSMAVNPSTNHPTPPTTSLPEKMETETSENPSTENIKQISDDNTSECVICLEAEVDCALYKCGHMCLCYSCAMDLKSTANEDKDDALCPICRQIIDDILRIFKS